jgi:hypothetical protein
MIKLKFNLIVNPESSNPVLSGFVTIEKDLVPLFDDVVVIPVQEADFIEHALDLDELIAKLKKYSL